MRTHTYPSLSSMQDIFATPTIVAVGELHGVHENAHVLRALLEVALTQPLPVCLAFEWLLSDTEVQTLRAFIHGGTAQGPIPYFFTESDGRMTAAHVELLMFCREYNVCHGNCIDIGVFDVTGAEREQEMAARLAALYGAGTRHVLAEMGVVHARRAREASVVDLIGATLPVHSIFHSYLSGRVNVDGELHAVGDSYEQQRGPADHFDSVVMIDMATPADESALSRALAQLYGVATD